MPDWIWLVLAALFGAFSIVMVVLSAAAYFLGPFEKKKQVEQVPTPVSLPPEILNDLTRGAGGTPEGALNALLQFIFQQSTADTRWLRRRMATELAELLTKTSSGKLFESLTLKSLEVGSEFPILTNLRLVSGELEEDGARLRSLDVKFDLAYDGNFTVDIDAVMLLGKIANVSITVESVSGSVRVMFRRSPYTHWAVAFEAPPRLDLRVRGRFQSRQLKPRLASLIAAHIRRAVAQRHTLPNYKIRYKPFFPKSEPGSGEGEEGPAPHGRLTVRLVEITRLQATAVSGAVVRASLAVDSHGWVSLRRGVLVADVVVGGAGGAGGAAGAGGLGAVCCQCVGGVRVDSVLPHSPAYHADLRRGDLLIAVDNQPVNNLRQVAKLIRAIAHRAITIRIQRGGVEGGMQRIGGEGGRKEESGEGRRSRSSFSLRRVSEVMEGVRLQGLRGAVSKTNVQDNESPSKSPEAQNDTESPNKQKVELVKQTSKTDQTTPPTVVGNFGLRKRRCSVENKSSDSSTGSTPSNSGASTPHKQANKPTNKHTDIPTIRTDSSECKTEPPDDDYDVIQVNQKQSEHIEICQMFWTKTVPIKPIIVIDEETEFKLNENHKYLNINVWGTVANEREEILLGYLNIPLAALLKECQDSTIPHHMKRYQFLPPDVDIKFSKSHKLSSHSGFEPCLCFGDALVWWEWESGAAPRASPARTPHPTPRHSTPAPVPVSATRSAHDFIRTHFHSSTQCDFCNKKIWLKDAMQCRNCGLCCHKKCVTKCQETSLCIPRQDSESSRASSHAPELITTDADSLLDPDSDDEAERKDSLDVHEEGGGAMSALVAGLRRAGSAHSLSAPRTNAASRSLPPSPSHTPRKQSLEQLGNPFLSSGKVWAGGGGVAGLLQAALRSTMPPDAMLAAARDSASDLAATLTPLEIHDMLLAVREELSRQDAGAACAGGAAAAAEEARACALTALMLHCCAAAQIAQQRTEDAHTHLNTP